MKKVFFISAMLLSLNTFAQHRKGEVLRNEITLPEYHYQKIRETIGHPPINTEVFINIPDGGRYRFVINDQIIENATGRFRFFDLVEGWHSLSIYENDILLYRTKIRVKRDHRLLLEFSYYNGLSVIDEVYIFAQNISQRPHKPHHYNNNAISEEQFADFFKHYQSQRFDDGKMKAFGAKKRHHLFSAEQIAKLLKEISFDDNQVKFAKEAYLHCFDPENYHKVIDALRFSTSASKIQDYIDELYK